MSDSNQFLEPPLPTKASLSLERRLTAIEAMADVQRRLLRCDLPDFRTVECSAMCRQAETVGGDFYDVFRLPSGELAITIGDVSGKGPGAALMMASVQATLRAEVRHATDVATVISRANELVHEASLDHYYATLFYATLDPATRVMKYVNAGHFPPLLVRVDRATTEWLDRGGPPVGMLPACTYDVTSIGLNPQDIVVAYTDGVIEARNASGQQFGAERLTSIVRTPDNRTPAQLSADITAAVDAFTCGLTQHDDMALVILRVLEGTVT